MIVLVAAPGALSETIVAETGAILNAAGAIVGSPGWLSGGRAAELVFDGIGMQAAGAAVAGRLDNDRVDRAVLDQGGRRKRLLIADMDSTILVNETLDEIAARAGVGRKVADITARSMRGDLNFEESLRARVALLKDHDTAIIDDVLATIGLTDGARALVATMRHHGAVTALVSGGDTMFTDRVRDCLGFHHAIANRFEISAGRLTGRLRGAIIGCETKRMWLDDLGKRYDIDPNQALAIGDGANDLAMIKAAGLGIAYYGKPVLRSAARAQINFTDLRTALYYQGYSDPEIVDGRA